MCRKCFIFTNTYAVGGLNGGWRRSGGCSGVGGGAGGLTWRSRLGGGLSRRGWRRGTASSWLPPRQDVDKRVLNERREDEHETHDHPDVDCLPSSSSSSS